MQRWRGHLYFEPDNPDDELEIAYCILDVDAVDVERVRTLLRLHLPELGAPAGTLVRFDEREDRFDGSSWQLNQPHSIDE